MAGIEKKLEVNQLSFRWRNRFGFPRWGAAGFAAAVLSFSPNSGQAETNLAPAGYPDPQCGELPAPPVRPDQFRFRADLEAYNARVSEFNVAQERYVKCLQTYVDNAASDIQSIKRKIEAAVTAARR